MMRRTGLEQDRQRQKDQQAGFDERRHRLDLRMSVMVLVVRGLVRGADGEIGEHRRADVEQAVQRLGHERQRTGENRGDELAQRQGRAGEDRGGGRPRLQLLEVFHILLSACACLLRPVAHVGAISKKEAHLRYLHTMVRVTDVDASLDFYCNKLGMTEVRRVESQQGRFTLIFLAAPADEAAGREKRAPLLELTYNWDPETYTGGRNFGHLAFEVDDIYATCDKLMKGGVTINRPPREGRMAFVRSPDNVSIELLQKGEALAPAEPWKSMQNTGVW